MNHWVLSEKTQNVCNFQGQIHTCIKKIYGRLLKTTYKSWTINWVLLKKKLKNVYNFQTKFLHVHVLMMTSSTVHILLYICTYGNPKY